MPHEHHFILISMTFLLVVWIVFCLTRSGYLSLKAKGKSRIVYDGQCPFCRQSVQRLKALDRYNLIDLIDVHAYEDVKNIHPGLTKELALRQVHLIESDGTIHGGFAAFERLCLKLPRLWLLIPVVFFPGMRVIGPFIYRMIARKRYCFH